MATEAMKAAEKTLQNVIAAPPETSHFTTQPVSPPRQRIEETSISAMIGLDQLRKDSRGRIHSFLGFESGKAPAEVPVQMKSQEEAKRYGQDLYDLYLRRSAAKEGLPPAPQGWRAPELFTAQDFDTTRFSRENEAMAKNVATTWLTPQYLGPWVGPAFRDHPPVVVTVPEEFFNAFQKANGGDGKPLGMYMNGTNIIFISDAVKDEGTRREVIVHESLHYAAYLGSGGHTAKFTRRNGTDGVVNLGPNNEALTQFHTRELMRAHGLDIRTPAYGPETVVASYLQKIAGDETLRRAFLTGDFTEVRRAVNNRLPPEYVPNVAPVGTFETMLKCPNGSEALAFMRQMMHSNNMDHKAWDQDPIVLSTGVV